MNSKRVGGKVLSVDITNPSLYDHVFSGEKEFIRAMAIEHTCANLGMEHLLDDLNDIESVHQQLLEEHFSAFLSELTNFSQKPITGGLEGKAERKAEKAIGDEMESWMKQARKDFEVIKKEGLPWTLRSSREVFERRL